MNKSRFFVKTHIPGLDEIIPGFPEGGLALVSGLPGSGKTIFGMSYIYYGAVEAQESGLYASMFESQEKFLHLSRSLGLDFEGLMKEGLVEHLQLPLFLEAGGASAVNMIIEKVKSLGAKRLVIDSFTAVKQAFKDPNEARVLLQTIISRVLEHLKCTTVLIKEGEPFTSGQSFEEYVADAVIGLEKSIFENRHIRILRIEKLRGAELRDPEVCFTIQKGVRVLPPAKLMTLAEAPSFDQVRWTLPPSPPGRYTTGIPDLDLEFGEYPEGSTILLEVDPRLSLREYATLVAPAAASHVSKGQYLTIIPSGGVTIKDVENVCTLYGINRKEFLERMYLLVEPGFIGEKTPNMIEVEPSGDVVKKVMDIVRRLSEKLGGPPIWIIGVDRVIREFGEKGIELLFMAKEYVRSFGNLMILILRTPDERLVRTLAPLADIHLKMTRKHGCVLLCGVKPETPLYAVQPDPSGRTPIPNIIPIV